MNSPDRRIAIFGDSKISSDSKNISTRLLKTILTSADVDLFYVSLTPGITFQAMKILAENALPFAIVLPSMFSIAGFNDEEMEIFDWCLKHSNGVICLNKEFEDTGEDKYINEINLPYLEQTTDGAIILAHSFEVSDGLGEVVNLYKTKPESEEVTRVFIIDYKKKRPVPTR